MVTGNVRVNGISLKGQVLMDLGPCSFSGEKARLKGDRTHRKFKFEQAKDARALGLPKDLYEIMFAENHVSTFLTKQEES